MSIFTLDNFSFRFPEANTDIIHSLSIEIGEADFVVVAGCTGSGKSTLLRMLKRELLVKGETSGRILFCGKPLATLSDRESASKIGYVAQNPLQQVVTDKVWHELSFGLENLGVLPGEIRKKVAEVSGWFGFNSLLEMNTADLSGGQLQLLNLAAIVAMGPEVILLDEPTAQLDPITAERFHDVLVRLNKDFGITIIVVEHNLSGILPFSDKMLVLEEGGKYLFGPTSEVLKRIQQKDSIFKLLPSGVQLALKTKGVTAVDFDCNCQEKFMVPMAIRDLSIYMKNIISDSVVQSEVVNKKAFVENKYEKVADKKVALKLEEVYFSYDQYQMVLKGMDLEVYEGEYFAILGSNGSGKTTALNVAAGFLKPDNGKVSVFEKQLKQYRNNSLYTNCLAVLPQNVQSLFLADTVEEELKRVGMKAQDLPFDISKLLKMHPYDLSGGEQQLLGLAMVLSAKPRIMLLDEPAKGLDSISKEKIGEVLKELNHQGMTIVLVTHDVEFAAKFADRIALVFDGDVASVGNTKEFLSENRFFTTDIAKIFSKIDKNVVFSEEAEEVLKRAGQLLAGEAYDK